MNNKTKDNIITFKVDKSIVKEMQGIHNRSEFLRSAVLAALGNHCPLCKGTGILTPNQKLRYIFGLVSRLKITCSVRSPLFIRI